MTTFKLWDQEIPYFREDGETPNEMHFYGVESDRALPLIVIYPGGGYTHRARHEGETIAEYYNSQGFHACVVDYRVRPNPYPAPLLDAQRAVKLLRARAEELKIDRNNIYTIGFSAGSHLAAFEAMAEDTFSYGDEADGYSCVPNGVILSYPMLSPDEVDGIELKRCFVNILPEDGSRTVDDYIPERLITPEAPPHFIWISSGDRTTAPTFALRYAARLCENHVQNEFHMFPGGKHGLGLALDYPEISKWANLSVEWIRARVKESAL